MQATRSTILRKGAILLLAAVALAPVAAATLSGPLVTTPDADVLVNVTESDLNLILQGLFHAGGGPRIDGRKGRVSQSVSDLRYHADLSDPVLTLGAGGHVALSSSIREARVQIGRLERKIGNRSAYCENAGFTVDPAHPLDITLALRFKIEDDDVRIVPERVMLSDTEEAFHLVKPSRCRNAPVPTWLLWWLGKPYLKRQLETLDQILLARADRSARELREGTLVRKNWRIASPFDARSGVEIQLTPRHLDTDLGSLLVSLARPEIAGLGGGGTPVGPPERRSESSFVGVSESFVNDLLTRAFSRVTELPHTPKGNVKRLFESSSAHSLIPGLRSLRSTDDVFFTFSIDSAPRVEFVGTQVPRAHADPTPEKKRGRESPGRPVIRVTLSGLELKVWERHPDRADGLLGALRVDSGTVGVAPYANRLGGISLEILENDWVVSSSGMEFNRDLFAATLQEMTFGEIFETRYNPMARSPLRVGKTEFSPRRFDVAGGYLLVDLAGKGASPAPPLP